MVKSHHLMLAKALFFTTAMGTVGWARFQNNYFLDHGMSSGQIGALKSFGLFFKLFGEPVWCFVADMYDAKFVFGMCQLMQIFTMEYMRNSRPLTFHKILFVKLLRTTTAPSSTLTSTTSLKLSEGSGQGFGQQRMFGSLAWGSGALIVGILIDLFGMNSLFYYTYFFSIVSFLFVIYGLPSNLGSSDNKDHSASSHASHNHSSPTPLVLSPTFTNSNSHKSINSRSPSSLESRSHHHSSPSHRDKDGTSSSSSSTAAQAYNTVHSLTTTIASSSSSSSSSLPLTAASQSLSLSSPQAIAACSSLSTRLWQAFQQKVNGLKRFFAVPSCRVVLINAFIYGCIMAVPETFLFISLEKDYGASRSFTGLCTTVSIVACLPLFWYSDHLIVRYGHHKLILLSQVLCIVRLLAYASLPVRAAYSPYVVLAIQLLHGFNFALFWSASVDLVFAWAPKDLATSCLSSLNMMYFTLGAAVGNLVWGIVHDLASDGVNTVYCCSALVLFFNSLYFSTISLHKPPQTYPDSGKGPEPAQQHFSFAHPPPEETYTSHGKGGSLFMDDSPYSSDVARTDDDDYNGASGQEEAGRRRESQPLLSALSQALS